MHTFQTKLRKLELLVYLVVVGYAAYWIWFSALKIQELVPQNIRHLKVGWISNRLVDLADDQWRGFRQAAPQIIIFYISNLIISKLVLKIGGYQWKRWWQLICGIAFAGYCHGPHFLFPALLILANFFITIFVRDVKFRSAIVWSYCCGSLLLAKQSEGFQFFSVWLKSFGFRWFVGKAQLAWHIQYNMSILRMLSYSMDYFQSRDSAKSLGVEIKDEKDINKKRIRTPLPQPCYESLFNYLDYIFYPFLYVAGPIITFNDFVHQRIQTYRQFVQSYKLHQILIYAARWLLVWLCLEFLTHFFHVNVIIKYKLWKKFSEEISDPVLVVTVTFWSLMFIWMKFVVIWRMMRLWCLLDGVDAPENMLRCLANNYDAEGFWRTWHASYNQWLVRYIYLPLGGRKYRFYNVWIIFTFVALWHDIDPRLIGWAWITCVFLAPEMVCKWILQLPNIQQYRNLYLFRHVCAAAGAINVIILMSANMVGFMIGLDGLQDFLFKFAQQPYFLFQTFIVLFCSVQLMFSIRDYELQAILKQEGNNSIQKRFP